MPKPTVKEAVQYVCRILVERGVISLDADTFAAAKQGQVVDENAKIALLHSFGALAEYLDAGSIGREFWEGIRELEPSEVYDASLSILMSFNCPWMPCFPAGVGDCSPELLAVVMVWIVVETEILELEAFKITDRYYKNRLSDLSGFDLPRSLGWWLQQPIFFRPPQQSGGNSDSGDSGTSVGRRTGSKVEHPSTVRAIEMEHGLGTLQMGLRELELLAARRVCLEHEIGDFMQWMERSEDRTQHVLQAVEQRASYHLVLSTHVQKCCRFLEWASKDRDITEGRGEKGKGKGKEKKILSTADIYGAPQGIKKISTSQAKVTSQVNQPPQAITDSSRLLSVPTMWPLSKDNDSASSQKKRTTYDEQDEIQELLGETDLLRASIEDAEGHLQQILENYQSSSASLQPDRIQRVWRRAGRGQWSR